MAKHDLHKEARRNALHNYFLAATEASTTRDLAVHLELELAGTHSEETITTKSILRDIKFLIEKKSAPIIKIGNGNNIKYAYSKKNFRLDNEYIGIDSLLTLEYACSMLEQFKHLEVHQDLKEIQKFLQNYKDTDYNIKNKQALFLENSNLILAKKIMSNLFEACSSQTVVEITYKTFTDTQQSIFDFHPFFLQSFNGRWFCIGYNATENKVYNYALDRIKKVKTISTTFNTQAIVTQKDYFKSMYGVTRLGKPEEIVFQIKKGRAQYFITKPFYEIYSKIQLPSGHYEFKMKIIINPELKSQLLSYGGDLKIISPDTLKKDLRKSATAMLKGF